MDTKIAPILSKDQLEGLLPWHKPEVQRLSVSLDTATGIGSNADCTGPTGPAC